MGTTEAGAPAPAGYEQHSELSKSKRRSKSAPAVISPEWLEYCDPESQRQELKDVPLVGIEEIDEGHRHLVNHYNALLRNLSQHRDVDAFALSFHRLVFRTRRHFEREEELMKRVGYTGYEVHRTVHRKLLGDAQQFLIELIGRHEGDRCMTVALWFRHWLINHIMSHDRKIGEFLSDGIWQH